MATITTLEAKRGSYVVALATGQGAKDELVTAGDQMAQRYGINRHEVVITELDPNERHSDRLIVVKRRYMR